MFASSVGGIGDGATHISSVSADGAGFGSANTLIPGALPVIDLPFVGELLGLSAGEEEVLRVVHAAYLKGWNRHVGEPVKKAERMSPWEMTEGASQPTYNQTIHEEKWAILDRAFERSLALDTTLFSDVAAAMSGTDREDRVNTAIQFRAFQRLEGGGGGSSMGFLAFKALQLPDPYRLVEGVTLDDAQREGLLTQLISIHDELAVAIDGFELQGFAAAQKVADGEREMFHGQEPGSEEGGAVAILDMDFEEQVNAARRTRRDTARRVGMIRAIIENKVIEGLEDLQQLEVRLDMLDQITGNENRSLEVVRRVAPHE